MLLAMEYFEVGQPKTRDRAILTMKSRDNFMQTKYKKRLNYHT
jgi:hypothetical protein